MSIIQAGRKKTNILTFCKQMFVYDHIVSPIFPRLTNSPHYDDKAFAKGRAYCLYKEWAQSVFC